MGLAIAVVATVGGCAHGVLDPRGPIGSANRLILLDSLVIMLAIVVPTTIGIIVCAWWFRSSNRQARYEPDFVYSGRLELIVWAIPILIILFLAGVIWAGSHDLDPFEPINSKQKPIEVQVVSLDWKWLFIYPDQGIASVNNLVVPAGVPVHFFLTSASVMNAFFVPQLGSMIATMPGMKTQLFLQADHAGDFNGLSTQFSGDGFSGMNFTLHAVTQDAFDAWVTAARGNGQALDKASYVALTAQSQNVQPFTYRSVETGLFDAVVRQQLPNGPGPQPETPAGAIRPIGGR